MAMAEEGTPLVLCVLHQGKEHRLSLRVRPAQQTMASVADQVRAAGVLPPEQHMRFICAGQELYLEDSVQKALGSVVHCVASAGPARRHARGKQLSASVKLHQQQSPAVDWLEVLDPGTVLMWVFGSILALLWLLFICYANMFDRTSLIMLCMMTIAFLIPCVLSYMPAVHLLQRVMVASGAAPRGVGFTVHSPSSMPHSSGAASWRPQQQQRQQQQQQQQRQQRQQQRQRQQQPGGVGSAVTRDAYGFTGSIPPRPLAPRGPMSRAQC